MKNSKKFLCVFVICFLVFASGCGSSINQNSNETNSLNDSRFESNSNSIFDSQSDNSTLISNSLAHVHSFDNKTINSLYLKTEPTLYAPGEYYYSCDCGEKGTEIFNTDLLDCDHELLDSYIDTFINEGSVKKPIWNKEQYSNIMNGSYTPSWNYIDGCMMISFLKLYAQNNDIKYFNFVKDYIDYFVGDGSKIKSYSQSEYNLDNINEGRVLFDLLEHTNDQKYKKAIDILYKQLENQPRNSYDSFWHKNRYTDQVWLDGLYMAQVFYTRYQTDYDNGDYSDIMNQFKNVETFMKDPKTGLYYHGFNDTKTQSWADKTTGLSKNFWLRSIGWYVASLSDLTEYLPKNSNEWKTIQGYLKGAVDSLWNFVDKEKFMLYQVVDRTDPSDCISKDTVFNGSNYGGKNYLETSGSALIAYSILNGVNTGALDESYWYKGKAIFNGICENKLSKNLLGEPVLRDICRTAGLSNDRPGTFEYYVNEKIVENEAKGVAPLIMAYVEILAREK